jgi:hypothetical protein
MSSGLEATTQTGRNLGRLSAVGRITLRNAASRRVASNDASLVESCALNHSCVRTHMHILDTRRIQLPLILSRTEHESIAESFAMRERSMNRARSALPCAAARSCYLRGRLFRFTHCSSVSRTKRVRRRGPLKARDRGSIFVGESAVTEYR